MTISICTFFALQVCVFAELDESAAALPPGFCTPFLAVSSQIVPHSPLRFFSLSQDIKCNFVPPCCLQKYQEIIAHCGLSSWDTYSTVHCSVLCQGGQISAVAQWYDAQT